MLTLGMASDEKKLLVFAKTDSIGVNDAHEDKHYLLNCFIDIGDLKTLESFEDPRCLIIGRTGAGKSALLAKLQADKGSRVIFVDAESLAMTYISNSSIVNSLLDLEIDLNTFFKYLWRHVVCVEVITKHLKITSDDGFDKFSERVRSEFRKKNPKHLKALDYITEWQNSFWKTTDSHVAEVTNKIEDKIEGELGLSAKSLKAKLESKSGFSSEERIEIKQRGQAIVNEMQLKEVAGLLDMLNDYMELHQSKYYVVVDKLDEKWVGNKIRYRLIKSLIETVKELTKYENIKPIATLRYDLIGRVFDITNDSGFQEEKYTSLYVNIRWTPAELKTLIDKRLNYLFHYKYSKRQQITITDVFPDTINGYEISDFLISRTLLRPRDLIEFVNDCINLSASMNGLITEEVVIEAERRYSRGRLDSLSYEWNADYPALRQWAKILSGSPTEFRVDSISLKALEDLALKYATNPAEVDIDSTDSILNLCNLLLDGRIDAKDFRKKIVYIYYRVSLVGIQEPPYNKVNWSHLFASGLQWDDIENDTILHIHPCFHAALKIAKKPSV